MVASKGRGKGDKSVQRIVFRYLPQPDRSPPVHFHVCNRGEEGVTILSMIIMMMRRMLMILMLMMMKKISKMRLHEVSLDSRSPPRFSEEFHDVEGIFQL